MACPRCGGNDTEAVYRIQLKTGKCTEFIQCKSCNMEWEDENLFAQ